LPRFAGHEFTVGTAAFVEPRWDFDATSLATRAERQGGDYVLTGEKCLVPLAARAEGILVYAAAPEGLAAFIVERGTPGLTVREREKNMGIKALDTFPVTLEGVRVPVRARLGGEGANLQPLVDASRIAVAALAVGIARAAFDYARDYAKERRAFGVAIAQKQEIDFELSEGVQIQRQMVHAVAEQAMRPIAREYDECEHEKPWDFLNMMWQVSSGNPVAGAEKKPREERSERNLAMCVAIEELSWGD